MADVPNLTLFAVFVTVIFSSIMVDIWKETIKIISVKWGKLNPASAWHSLIFALIITAIFTCSYWLFAQEVIETRITSHLAL